MSEFQPVTFAKTSLFNVEDYPIKETQVGLAALTAARKPSKPKTPRFQDEFELQLDDIIAIEMTTEEIVTAKNDDLVFDVECFVNYFCCSFKHLKSGKYITFEQYEVKDNENIVGCGGVNGICDGNCDGNCLKLFSAIDTRKLHWILSNFCSIGFNSRNYDLHILQLVMQGSSCEKLFEASKDLIVKEMRFYDFVRKWNLERCTFNHIDLIEVAPLEGSLKLYAGRLHTKRMQEMPVSAYKHLTRQEMIQVLTYNRNDLGSTELLFNELHPQISLRESLSVQYQLDLRSKSDAQIAEAVIVSELEREQGYKIERPDYEGNQVHFYRIPTFIGFVNPDLKQILEIVRNAPMVLDGMGYVRLPSELEGLTIKIAGKEYKLGIGGLHSREKCQALQSNDEYVLIDCDVASYYPKIVLNERLYPRHLGVPFLHVYNMLVERRLAAKTAKRKVEADSLKIVANGSFGKLGDSWSKLFAPDLMIQVTLTGQLALLMLIEMIEDLGISVVSANTDGVLIRAPRTSLSRLSERIAWWERQTGFKMEEKRYKGIYARDVNNYIAIPEELNTDDKSSLYGRLLNHGCKVKGVYAEVGSALNSPLSCNPQNQICSDAVINLLLNGTTIEETIETCKDVRLFSTVRRVTGGAIKSGVHLGKIVRWYYSTEMKGTIDYAKSGNKVPLSDGARPLMQLPVEFPSDVNLQHYKQIAYDILSDIGYLKSGMFN
jgi:hypothetical protein